MHYCKVDALACFLSAFVSKALSQIAREEEGEIDRIVFNFPLMEWLDHTSPPSLRDINSVEGLTNIKFSLFFLPHLRISVKFHSHDPFGTWPSGHMTDMNCFEEPLSGQVSIRPLILI